MVRSAEGVARRGRRARRRKEDRGDLGAECRNRERRTRHLESRVPSLESREEPGPQSRGDVLVDGPGDARRVSRGNPGRGRDSMNIPAMMKQAQQMQERLKKQMAD